MSKSLRKFLLYLLSSIIVITITVSFYIFIPKKIESIDNTLRDYMFLIRGELPNSGNVVIIDIDDKSLLNEGQWPWSRDKLAKLVTNLSNNGAGIIGYDIIFAEKDRTSPSLLVQKHPLLNNENYTAPDYDKEFAEVLKNSPSILGYQFQFGETIHKTEVAPNLSAVFLQRNKPQNLDHMLQAKGILLNIPSLQNSAYSSGFINNVPEESGMSRSVPLIIQYDDEVYPSLALEIIRNIYGIKKVILNYDEFGLVNVQLGKDLKIPTDIHGRLTVNFRGDQFNFPYISATDILNDNFDPKIIEGKIVLIGTSAPGLFDLRSTPFDSVFPGVEIHANVLDNILMEDFIYKPSWVYGFNILTIIAIVLILTFTLAYSPLWFFPIIVTLFTCLSVIALYYALFTYGIILNIFFVLFSIILTVLITLAINYFYENKQSKIIKNKFANKVSKEVMEELLLHDDTTVFKGNEKELTVYFSDIRGFTTISENMPNAKALIDYINLYMEPMSRMIVEEKGTIDKYIGDAIMAYWNAPYTIKNHADKAVVTSLKQLKHLKKLNSVLKEKKLPLIEIGIGINTGKAVVGEMGSTIRSDYTVIGDTVNLASRVESLCKQYNAQIIITNFVMEKLTGEYVIRYLDLVKVKGKSEEVEIFEVLDFGKADKAFQEQLDNYHQAVTLYHNSKFNEALQLFKLILQSKERQSFDICNIYIDRCEKQLVK